jgi:NAD(P)-dependent dehydrogenase (short-subunit alcohol dehydrogenase family)
MQDTPVALVTRVNNGIGLETVRRFIGAGHRVYLASRDIKRGRAAAETVGACLIRLVVTSDDSVRHAAGAHVDR